MKKWWRKKMEKRGRTLEWRYFDIDPDFVIGHDYLWRWWLVKNMRDHDTGKLGSVKAHTRKSRWLNVYLHCVHADDDDRALHDHPWLNISIVLRGAYREVFTNKAKVRRAGSIVLRKGSTAHRLEVMEGPVWTLFITGPKYREWGFRCQKGFVHWRDFVSPDDTGQVGRGCD